MDTKIPGATENLWDSRKAEDLSELEALAYRSNLLGRDRAVANYGGGNTSAKGRERDHTGREVDVLWVKGSGSDLATIEAGQFTGLKLDEVLALEERENMSDEEMVAYLASCQLTPSMPRGSIETLLHAFVPHPHVDHTHPDAINMVCCSEGGEEFARECFGEEAVWIPYIRPGFTLSKQVGEAVKNNPNAKFVLLAKHGLVTWGETHEETYGRTIEAINRAAEFVAGRAGEPFGGREVEPPAPDKREALLAGFLPALRGALSAGSEQSFKILRTDHTSEDVLSFVCGRDSRDLSQVGAACPDHLVRTKVKPLWVDFDPQKEGADELRARLSEGVARYREDYAAYFSRHEEADEEMFDPNPRVVFVQGLGLVAAAKNAKEANLSRDFAYRAINVMRGAHALGGYVSLTEEESYAVEYWPLELYKLTLAPPPDELAGRVAFVTGGAGGIGSAVARSLASRGACVVVSDLDEEGAREIAEDLPEPGIAAGADVTDEGEVAGAYRRGPRVWRGRRRRVERRPRLQRPHPGDERRDVGQELRCPRQRLLPGRARGLSRHERAGRWRQPRLRGLQELHGRGQERIGVLLGEGGRVAPGAVPGRGGRIGAHQGQHRQPRCCVAGVQDLGLRLARGARRCIRHRA